MSADSEVKLLAYGQTDKGLVRQRNDDSFLVMEDMAVYAVADGLGGLPEGEVASRMAIEAIEAAATEAGRTGSMDFARVFQTANVQVQQTGREINEDVGIGTTLTVARVEGSQLHIGHVGDSGVLLFRGDAWRQITEDHTMAQDMLKRLGPGEHAFIPEYFSHTLTRCIGQSGPIEADVHREDLEPGDRVFLFTDGVTKTLHFKEIQELIFAFDEPKTFVRKVIKMANERGGPDNVTAVAVFVL